MTTILKVRDLNFRYDRGKVLDNIHFEIKKGSFSGLIGPNGSGKSTLIKVILGLLKKQSGQIELFTTKQNLFKQWEKIGFVSQKSNSFNSAFPATVKEVVASGLTKKKGLFKMLNQKDQKSIDHALETVGMTGYSSRNIGELSGGEQQRVFIARSLISEPELLILDEPTVGIDAQNVQNFYELLKKLNKNHGLTLLLVTHDHFAINVYVNHVISINKRILFDGTRKEYHLYLEQRESGKLNLNEKSEELHCDCHTFSI